MFCMQNYTRICRFLQSKTRRIQQRNAAALLPAPFSEYRYTGTRNSRKAGANLNLQDSHLPSVLSCFMSDKENHPLRCLVRTKYLVSLYFLWKSIVQISTVNGTESTIPKLPASPCMIAIPILLELMIC